MLFEIAKQIDSLNSGPLMNLYHQIEAILALYKDIEFEKGLPPTRGWAASPDFLRVIANHILQNRPTTAVECGSGISTLIQARCMQINRQGHVYSLDHDTEYAQKTREQLEKYGLSDYATVLDAPLKQYEINDQLWSWYNLDKLAASPIDLLVVDGPLGITGPLARYPVGPLLFSRLSDHATIFFDDAMRPDETVILEKFEHEFPQLSQSVIFGCEKGCVRLDLVSKTVL